jgi:3-hydroxymyristoyl/3-hydroxydecanoyl-(acyl carrier protein) dehydratase
MAQTAGILVGHARDFAEKVILAKIGRATFERDAFPGQTLIYTATLDRIDDAGAATTGTVEVVDLAGDGIRRPVGTIELMFSHIDKNMRGLGFPEHNFVFTDQFFDLLRNSGFDPGR